MPGTRSAFDKSEFSLPSLLPASSPGTQAFQPPATLQRWPSQRPPFMSRVQSSPFTRVPWAFRPRPPPVPRHWPYPLPVRTRIPPTTATPGSKLWFRSFPTAGTLQQLLIGPACQPLLLIGGSLSLMGGAVACRSERRLGPAALV